MLEGDKLLLLIDDRRGHLLVCLEPLSTMNAALDRGRWKSLDRGKLGDSFKFAFDEIKRTLALCSAAKVRRFYIFGSQMQNRKTEIPAILAGAERFHVR